MPDSSKKLRWWICVALGLVTLALYVRTVTFDFVNYDDPDYILQNPMVNQGLSLKGIGQAFTRVHAANWHPLTWISHMLDCEIYGPKAGGHHLTNAMFHSANSVLLFLLCFSLTGATWRSAVVAALFALHPAHVESVAWVSERKDVLSTFFGLLAILGYVRWTRVRTRLNLAAALGCFALSLLAKGMFVTLPFVLLLLDFWPLNRIENRGWRTFLSPAFRRLVIEKWTWFLLTIAVCVITFYAQKEWGAVSTVEQNPLSFRIGNALTSYWTYVGKLLWPVNLSVFYPLFPYRLILPVLLAGFGLAIACFWLMVFSRSRPYLLTGWFWFLGTLVPVIGLVQVGSQSMADRYTYVPSIGLFVLLVWGVDDLLKRSSMRRSLGLGMAALALVFCARLCWSQIGVWQNSVTLFSHSLETVGKTSIALNNLGTAYADLGEEEKAIPYFREALEQFPLDPLPRGNLSRMLLSIGKPQEALDQLEIAMRQDRTNARLYILRGNALVKLGKPEEAINEFHTAIQMDTNLPQAYSDLGLTLANLGRVQEGITNIQHAIAMSTNLVEAYNNLAGVLIKQKQTAEAMSYYEQALRIAPSNSVTHYNLGLAKDKLGRPDEAFAHFRAAVFSDKKHAEARFQYGRHLFMRGQIDEAARWLQEALVLKGNLDQARLYLGLALFEIGDETNAVVHLREASMTLTNSVEAANGLAWALATGNDPRVRDGATAVSLAEIAAAKTQGKQPAVLRTLAAAYASAGRFEVAINTAKQAVALANAQGQGRLSDQLTADLERYERKEPLFHAARARQ